MLFKLRSLLLLVACCLGTSAAAERPNILWIVSEDTSAFWLGCYGNREAKTPRLDRLASEGSRFTHAYSNAAVCAVARSTLLNGIYAPSQGTQHMRSRHPIPAEFRPYVSYLRGRGYYCTNAAKTDYNFKGKDAAIWDESSNKAHYRNRKEGQPFFAIFNLGMTHESSLFRQKKEPVTRLKPAEVFVPPYLPDLPEVRSDIARYHDRVTQLDDRVGGILDELENAGLAEDTIVFYFSDHGGAIPRGKRYLEDSGVRVPLLVRVPGKWRKLSPFKEAEPVSEPVSFVDFAPTLLSLSGLEKAPQMQGRAFLGDHRREPARDAGVFLFADRFDELYGMRRGWTEGRWKYIRRFMPQQPAAPYSNYSFGQPAWQAWREAYRKGTLKPEHARLWESPQPVEELFDTEADPWEVKNLAADPEHAARLAGMRDSLKRTMTAVRDTGIVPEPMFAALGGEQGIVPYVRAEAFDYGKNVDLAFRAGEGKDLERFKAGLGSKDPVERYWSLLGLRVARNPGKAESCLEDEHSANRVLAAEILWVTGKQEQAKATLAKELTREIDDYSLLNLVNVLERLEIVDGLPSGAIEGLRKRAIADENSSGYVRRFLKRFEQGAED